MPISVERDKYEKKTINKISTKLSFIYDYSNVFIQRYRYLYSRQRKLQHLNMVITYRRVDRFCVTFGNIKETHLHSIAQVIIKLFNEGILICY
jgi:hypothetical protein